MANFSGCPYPEIIDNSIFGEILEMDPDGSFVASLIQEWRCQATDIVGKLHKEHEAGDLGAISKLGHFLKGSSASLGVARVRETCEQLQHVGNLRSLDGKTDIHSDEALKLVPCLLKRVEEQLIEADRRFSKILEGREGSVPSS